MKKNSATEPHGNQENGNDTPILNDKTDNGAGNDSPPIKIWVTENYYLKVDKDGKTYTEDTFEGALGYVLRLYHGTRESIHQALKIPKLIGATLRENAYIIKLMNDEINNVEKVEQGGIIRGVISPHEINPLRGKLNLENSHIPDAAKYHDQIIAFSCAAGDRPRFLSINNKGETHPEISNPPEFGENLIQEIESKAERFGTKWGQAVYMIASPTGTDNQGAKLSDGKWVAKSNDDAEISDAQGETWYAGAPSVIYKWADGTLQMAVSKFDDGGRDSWSPQDHILLTKTICEGLETLHRANVIHADNRPANIMYIGDPKDPKNYVIVDYGSMVAASGGGPAKGETGHTLIHNAQRTDHISVFYAPERYQGTERESARAARIVKDKNDPGIVYLVLGWEIDKKLDDLTFDTLKKAGEHSAGSGEGDDALLNVGDHVQIQDYIFEVADREFSCEGFQIYPCKPMISRIVQARVGVSNNGENIPDNIVVDKVVETKQWSAATDIFSLGVLLLYSIFHRVPYDPEEVFAKQAESTGVDNHDEVIIPPGNGLPAQEGASDPENPSSNSIEPKWESPLSKSIDGIVKENAKVAENQFQEMINHLSSVPIFRTQWPELTSIRKEMEASLKSNDSKPISQRPYRFDEYNQKPDPSVQGDEGNMYTQAVKVIKRITQNVPHTRRIVAALDFDLAAFIFVIHFAMACLHRRSHLSNIEGWMKEEDLPFCINRREGTSSKAAERARKRLDKIIGLLGNVRLDGFRIGNDWDAIERDVPVFRPTPPSDLINKNLVLIAKLTNAKDALAKITEAEKNIGEAYQIFLPGSVKSARELIKEAIDQLEEVSKTNEGS